MEPTIRFDPSDLGNVQEIAIGHGPLTTCPLHLAMIIASVANSTGAMVRPYVVKSLVRESGTVVIQKEGGDVLSEPLRDGVHLKVQEALKAAAEGYRLEMPGGTVMAKTGTATLEGTDDLNNVFLAFSVITPGGRRLAGCLSREKVKGTSSQLKPLAREVILKIEELEQEGKL